MSQEESHKVQQSEMQNPVPGEELPQAHTEVLPAGKQHCREGPLGGTPN